MHSIKYLGLVFILFAPSFAGGYVVQPDKLPNYVIPDLTGFKVSFLFDSSILNSSESNLKSYLNMRIKH